MKDLLGRNEALTVEAAVSLLNRQKLKPPAVETVSINSAYGRVLAQDIHSPENLPGFDRSTMDGYAVNSADTFGASETMPAYLQVKGRVLMGHRAELKLHRGEACQIPTGGMLPEGADAVVMLEYTNSIDTALIEIMKTVSPGENVVLFDEDVRKGDAVIKAGHRNRPQDIAALAGLGILRIDVYKKPVVAVISTGDEVVPAGSPLSAGEVRDINSYNLAGMILACNALPLRKEIVKDDLAELREAVSIAFNESDMLLISGGSSVGAADHTATVIDELGPPGVLFHGVAMKPGKPLIGGIVNGKPVFGLPGHPAAVTVGFETFVEPVLTMLSGEIPNPHLPPRRTLKALFGRNLSSAAGREEHVRVSVEKRGDALWAIPVLGKSGLIRTLVQADGIVIIPRNKSGLYEGEEIEVRLFR